MPVSYPAVRALLTHPVAIALLVAAAARIAVFGWAYFTPLTNEIDMPVSPTLVQPWIEFSFYARSLELYRSLSLLELVGRFVEFYQRPLALHDGHIIAGPVFPALIALFDYREGHTLGLAVFFLVMSVVLSLMWLLWLWAHQVGLRGLLVFALLPNPFWFMLNVTTDLLFAVLVAAFYLIYSRETWRASDVAVWCVFLVLCMLTRPNGIALLMFVALDFLFRSDLDRRTRLVSLCVIGFVGVVFSLYLYPYFITELNKVLDFRFFGIAESDYVDGVYGHLPRWLDLPLSWMALIGSKILYFVGLRPSYGGIDWQWVVLRAAAGLILLPGLIYLVFGGRLRDRLFVWVYFLPVFMGPTQDRYNLAIQPILFFYGLRAYDVVWRGLRTRVLRSRTRLFGGAGGK